MYFKKCKKMYLDSRFSFEFPLNIIAIFTNPFYLIRRNLYFHIKKYAKYARGNILDFGCGRSPYRNLFKNCKSYIGCDIELSGHKHEHERIDVFYDGKVLPFKDQKFDWIFSSEVFEHIFNLEEVMKELNRVLIPGGKMLITVPFVWNEHEIPYDNIRYTSFGIKYLFEENGFEIIEIKKSTLFFEAIIQMFIEYIRKHIYKMTANKIIIILCQIFLVGPITVLGIILSNIFPKDDSFYSNNIVLCKKRIYNNIKRN